jgi:hypothetical protein
MEATMTRQIALIVAVAMAAVPIAALAQTSGPDVRYCDALADTYTRYIGHDSDNARRLEQRGTLDGQLAVAQCHEGRAAEAIPVLEQILRNNGFDLPNRG